MKLLIVLCFVTLAVAAPQEVQILRYNSNTNGLGNYIFGFEQSDGTKHEQKGELKNAGRDDEVLVVTGKYSWVGPDGVTYTVTYKADEGGYQPQIEQGPGGGVPPAVIASLLG